MVFKIYRKEKSIFGVRNYLMHTTTSYPDYKQVVKEITESGYNAVVLTYYPDGTVCRSEYYTERGDN